MDLHYGSHTDHLHQQHQSAPLPAPAIPKPLGEVEEESAKPRPFFPLSLPNGTHKNHRQEPPPPLAWSRPRGRHECRKNHVVYRECMKNHAAPLGGHALDGCGEFIPSPASNPSTPASLTCAACGCHRNFHRRLLHSDEREEGVLEERDDDVEGHSRSPPPPGKGAGFNQYSSSAPHMLMVLSAGYHGTPVRPSGSPPVVAGTVSAGTPTGVVARTSVGKRFRTKFSPEQKARMQEVCEQLGWRMQRRDDALVEKRCQEIGVSRGVFKVWMHNNKHAFVGGLSSRRGGGGSGGGSTADHATSCGEGGGGGGSCVVSVNGDSGNGGSIGHAVDGSPVSSGVCEYLCAACSPGVWGRCYSAHAPTDTCLCMRVFEADVGRGRRDLFWAGCSKLAEWEDVIK
ncbi:hypothetical protein Taro_040210 [Colocasia esculenta]|uniref:ZF-HD dimerization-type domain-containing protein n=1 Tax=Colocasia esculenta TaxID=4460 RepID=A0A843WPM0_COLES|nr:hypothetical protein [Colocasia esculenta]